MNYDHTASNVRWRGWPSPRPMAMDQEIASPPDDLASRPGVKELLKHLYTVLPEDGYATVYELISQCFPEDDEEEEDGLKTAMDAKARAAYDARFPNAHRLGHASVGDVPRPGCGGGARQPARLAMDAAALAAYAARFPNAARINGRRG